MTEQNPPHDADPTRALTVVDAAIRNMRPFYGPASPAEKTEATTLMGSTADAEVAWHRSVLAYSQLVATRVQIDQNAILIQQNQAIGAALTQLGLAFDRLGAQQKVGAELVANAVGEAVRISLGLDEGEGEAAPATPPPVAAKLALVPSEADRPKRTSTRKKSPEGGEDAMS